MKKIRFGVIGCGSIANEYHLPALRRVEGAQLVWACDLIEERAQKAKDDFGFEKYTLDYHDILNDSSIDAVGIMRNMKDDPYEIMKRYANRIAHFHAKDIFRYGDDGWEIEPIVGMGQLKWNVMLGMLWNVGYDGYIIIEPHGDVWAEPENRWKHIVLAKRHLEQYMIR